MHSPMFCLQSSVFSGSTTWPQKALLLMNPASELSVDWGELARLGNGLSQHLKNHCSVLSCIYPILLAIALKNTHKKKQGWSPQLQHKVISGRRWAWACLSVVRISCAGDLGIGLNFCEGNFPYSPWCVCRTWFHSEYDQVTGIRVYLRLLVA